jgi:hypothetical protein
MVDAENYKIKIKDLSLFVRNVQLSPAVRMGHVKAFEKTSSRPPTFSATKLILKCLKSKGIFVIVPFKASLSTQPITSLFGNYPKNML